jgi:hypothetical protein
VIRSTETVPAFTRHTVARARRVRGAGQAEPDASPKPQTAKASAEASRRPSRAAVVAPSVYGQVADEKARRKQLCLSATVEQRPEAIDHCRRWFAMEPRPVKRLFTGRADIKDPFHGPPDTVSRDPAGRRTTHLDL